MPIPVDKLHAPPLDPNDPTPIAVDNYERGLRDGILSCVSACLRTLPSILRETGRNTQAALLDLHLGDLATRLRLGGTSFDEVQAAIEGAAARLRQDVEIEERRTARLREAGPDPVLSEEAGIPVHVVIPGGRS